MISVNDIEKELDIKLTSNQKLYFQNRQFDKYVLPASNIQISTLLNKFNRPAVYYNLCQLISKFKKSWDFATFTYFLLKNKKSKDFEIYEKIFQDIPKISSVREYSKSYVADYLINIFDNLKLLHPKSLLDIGCGNCIMTRDLGIALNLKKEDIYGADIPEEFEQKWIETRPKDINFVLINNNKLKFNRKFDLITCMMVLHHVPVEYLNQYLQDIYNLLNNDGLFIIKEHDCFNATDYIIADIEHSLYIVQEAFALQNDKKLSEKSKQDISQLNISYKDRFTWRVLIQRIGFKCIYENPFDYNLTNTYSPNRAYLAIFQKKIRIDKNNNM
jgi:2-polyprenyl-3-methyl-5-hydroxy-6-metoxy-1,4-benzoquinol methylase